MDKLIRTIKAVSLKKKDEGSIGFLTKEEDRWFNMAGDPSVLEEWLKTTIKKGNTIEFDIENGFVNNLILKEKAKEESFDDLITFEDLLNDAHEKFDWMSIKTELIENDWENKRAIFKATVTTCMDGEMDDFKQTFEAYGDATQENCGEMVKKHYIRMAETRAISRALRWATNNAKAAAEETENGELQEPRESDMAQE
jgi:hypothetical protein